MGVVQVNDPPPAVVSDCVDDGLVVVRSHADGVVQEPRRRCQYLKRQDGEALAEFELKGWKLLNLKEINCLKICCLKLDNIISKSGSILRFCINHFSPC